MREILFRGKEKDQWVSGYYWKYEQNGKEFHVIRDSADKLLKFNHICAPETLGQYTGLTDKNGTKIFEGDIVITYDPDDSPAEVVYDESETQYGIVIENIYYCLGAQFRGIDLEVIGNIYDNPELIEDMDIKPAAKMSDTPAEQLGLAPAT